MQNCRVPSRVGANRTGIGCIVHYPDYNAVNEIWQLATTLRLWPKVSGKIALSKLFELHSDYAAMITSHIQVNYHISFSRALANHQKLLFAVKAQAKAESSICWVSAGPFACL